MTRWVRAKYGMFSRKFCHAPERPWTKRVAGPPPSRRSWPWPRRRRSRGGAPAIRSEPLRIGVAVRIGPVRGVAGGRSTCHAPTSRHTPCRRRSGGAPLERGARRPRPRCSCVPHPLEDRDLSDLGRLQVVPEDPRGRGYWRSTSITARGVADQIDGQVMGGARQVLAQDLDGMDGGGDRGVVVDLAAWIRSPYSRSEKPPPLPTLAPLRLTATEPQRTKSMSGSSSSATTRPCFIAPSIVAASRTLAESLGDRAAGRDAGREAAAPP